MKNAIEGSRFLLRPNAKSKPDSFGEKEKSSSGSRIREYFDIWGLLRLTIPEKRIIA